jgi:tetratricopeptide (TPR) repeat protein
VVTVGRGAAAVLLVLLLGGCIFFDNRLLQTRSMSARHDAETRAAAKLYPAPLRQPRPAARGEVRALKVRVWADASFRKAPRWRDRIIGRFARANEFLRQALGVELEVETRAWERGGDEVEEVGALLAALLHHDPGDDVDHVVAMTGGLPRVSVVHEQLGGAVTPGKHMVIRALTDAAEYQAIAAALPTLSRSDLDDLGLARLAHKESAVLIHEWAHNLGALHDDEDGSLMTPGYHHLASGFSDATLALLARELASRASGAPVAAAPAPQVDWVEVGDGHVRRGEFTRADEAYARAGPAGEGPRERARLMRRQRGLYGVAPEDEPAASEAVEEAHAAVGGGDRAAAREVIDAGLRRWPRLAGLLALRCFVELQAGQKKAAGKSCARALETGEESLYAQYVAGHLAVARGRRAEAIARFERAIELDPGATPAYEALGRLYAHAGATAELEALRAAYRARFGKPLPL